MHTSTHFQPLAAFRFESRPVRVQDRDGEPWFVGKDVCDCLEISNHNDSLSRLEDDERKGVAITDPLGKNPQTLICINEPGLYRLIFTSRTEKAEAFKRWLAHEVLPALRRQGRYELSAAARGDDMDGPGEPSRVDLLDGDAERMWQSRILLYHRVYGRRAAQWAFAHSPLPKPPAMVLVAGRRGEGDVPESVERYVDERLHAVPGARVRARVLYNDYRGWCGRHGFEAATETAFGRGLNGRVAKIRHAGRVVYLDIQMGKPKE